MSDVFKKGPAEKADLRIGDIILEVNGMRINTADEFSGLLYDASPGDVLKLKVFREKKMIDLELRLERRA